MPPFPSPQALTAGARLTVTDHVLAGRFDDIVVGKAFVFLGEGAFEKPGLGWVQRLLGGAPRPRVVSLIGRHGVDLPGAQVHARTLAGAALGSVTSDKALYREGHDDVRLLALDPFAPHTETALEIRANGAEFGKRAVRLDGRGAAAATLRDLPAGDYEVRLRGAPKDAPACAFTVAAYKLAPLVARLARRSLEGERLTVHLVLESFGVPVDGKVQLELTDRGRRLATVTAEARGGAVEATFRLTGEGPHAIQAQLVADPARTATVPIVGSRLAERRSTVFSPLGAEITGSLLPSPGSIAVRGIHLEEGASRTSPFRLERVDARRARLTTATDVKTARVVVIDPRTPAAREGAVDPDGVPHPGIGDERYRRGEELFLAGKLEDALEVFEEARAAVAGAPHPNYAYYIACALARLGRTGPALAALDEALRDGWKDFALLARDEDLTSLRGHPIYEARRTGGLTELSFEDLAAGATIEVDVPPPMALLAIGAYAGGSPWEGWAAVVAPPALSPRVEVPELATPGEQATIEIATGAEEEASVYVIVKDARLLSQDTPESRLAGGIKAFVERASKELAVARPALKLSEAALPPPPPPPSTWAPPIGGGFPPPGFAPPAPMAVSGGPPPPAPGFGPPTPMAPTGGPPPPAQGFAPPAPAFGGPPQPASTFGPPQAAARPSAALESLSGPSGAAAPSGALAPSAAPAGATWPPGAPAASGAPAPGPGPYRGAPPPPPPSVEEPEVLFAGLVEARDGRGRVTVRLGPDFTDYLVEAFVTTGLDWAPVEARFRAAKETFVSLDVPAFVHPQDAAIGRVHVGSRGDARLTVTCDGAEVPLLVDGKPLAPGETLPAGRAEVAFIAGPGLYEAHLDDGGASDRIAKRVDVPGKIRRLARGVRLLEPGQRLDRSGDPSIVGLRVLPGLNRPFRALVSATADYSYACCEQTAAKVLSACAMYALADDRRRRDEAEAIILAGVRREARMWLRGRGFKTYPEYGKDPDRYYGPKAARYLHNLGLLSDLRPSRSLSAAIAEGLEMARDTTAAYRLDWPPRRPVTCEDAYSALRFGGAAADGLAVARKRAAAPGTGPASGGGAVGMRVETAYAAAVLFGGGGASELSSALALANLVISQLGEHGRLYSTLDSVAVVALMAELTRAGIVGDAGVVEIDGRSMTTAEAVAASGEARSVRAERGVVAVEVTRLVEEDWSRFDAGLPVRVALEKGGRPTRRLEALDAVDLVVTLESGYKPGDICWVCLPDALSRVIGGGQVKRFGVDFEGKDQVRIPLAATSPTVDRRGEPAPSFYAVCVRNMFEEERGGNPGLLDVTVAPPGGGSSVLDRAVSVFRGLFRG